MDERGYAILLWHNDTLVGIYAVVRSMEQAENMCECLLKDIKYSEFDSASWMPTFIEGE